MDETCKVVYFEATKVSQESNTLAFNQILGSVFKFLLLISTLSEKPWTLSSGSP